MQIDTLTHLDGSKTAAIKHAAFTAADGVTFSGAVDAAGHVVLDVDDPAGEADNRLRLLADDLEDLAGLLQRLRRASAGSAKDAA